MMFNRKYYDKIIKTESFFKDKSNGSFTIENDIVEKIDVVITAHFGNTVSCVMKCRKIFPLPLYNSTNNIGHIIKAIIEIFELEDEDGVGISELKNIPIRIVFDDLNCGKAVAIGHFLEDRFIMIDDLMHIGSGE